MAIFKLTLKIDRKGSEVFDQTKKDAEELNKELAKTGDSAQSFKEIESTTKDIGKNISLLQSQIAGTIKSVVSQTVGAVQQTTDTLSISFGKTIETILGRLAILGVGVKVALSQSFLDFKATAILSSTGLFSFIAVFAKNAISSIGPVFNNVIGIAASKATIVLETIQGISGAIGLATASTTQFIGGVLGLGAAASTVAGFFAQIASGAVFFAGSATAIFAINVALKESVLLIKRFFGFGIQSATPLERITNIIVTIDNTFRSIGLTGGALLKTFGLLAIGATGFGGPLVAIAATLGGVNSAISNVLKIFLRGRLSILAFFGSARAQIGLIILDLKELAVKQLPILAKRAEAFKILGQNVEKADKAIKKTSVDAEKLNQVVALQRGRLPIQQQFAIFALEIKNLFKAVLTSVNTVSILLKNVFKLTDTQFQNINQQAKKATDTTISGIEKSSKGVQDIFERGTKTAGVFAGIGDIFRRTFGGKNPLLDSLEQSDKKVVTLGQRLAGIAKATETGFTRAFRVAFSVIPNILGRIGSTIKTLTGGLLKTLAKRVFPSPKVGQRGGQQKTADLRQQQGVQQTILLQTKKTNEELQKTSGLVNQVTRAKMSAAVIQVLDPKKIKPTQIILRKVIDDFVKFGQLPVFAQKKGVVLVSEKQKALLNTFGVDLQRLISSGKQFTAVDLAKVFGKLDKGLQGVVKAIPKGADRDRLQNFLRGLTDPKFIVVPKNLKAISDGLKTFKKVAAGDLGVRKFVGLGDAIKGVAGVVAKSFASNKVINEVKNSVLAMATVLADFLQPKSPPKKGPLRTINTWGLGLSKELVKGMFKGVNIVAKGALTLAKRIAGFFPSSPALFGPLVALPQAGLNIGLILVAGMQKSVSAVASAASALGTVIFGNLTRAFEVDLFAERFGIGVEILSSFNLALADVGANTSDFQFALTGLNRILGKTLTPEDRKKFQGIGLDIEKARNSAEPTVELFLQLADVLEGIPPQSQKFKEALESVGIIATSSIVNVLQKGREELEGFQLAAAKSGTVLNSVFAKASRRFVGLFNQLKEIRKTFLNPLIEEILPVINKALEDLINIFRENRQVIETFLRVVGKAFSALLKIVFNFARIVITEPRKAFEIVATLAKSLGVFIKDVFFLLIEELGGLISRFTKGLGPLFIGVLGVVINNISSFVLTGFGKLVSSIFGSIDKSIVEGFRGLLVNILIRIGSFVKEIVAGLTIGLSDALKTTKVGTKIGEFLGLVLSEQQVSRIGSDLKKLENQTTSFTSSIVKVFSDASAKSQSFSGVIKDSFDGLFDEKSQERLSGSLSRLTKTFKKTFGEISDFKITNTDLTKSIGEAADLFKEKFGDSIEFAFGEDARLKTETFFSSVGDKIVEFGGRIGDALDIDFQGIKEQVGSVFESLKQAVQVQEDSGKKRAEIEESRVEQCQEIAKKEISCTQKKFDAQLALASQFNGAASKLASGLTNLIGKESEELFNINKGFAISQAIINTAQGVSKALAEGGIAGIALGALVAAAGAVEIANIAAQKPPSLEEGGMVSGPSHAGGGVNASVAGIGMVNLEGGEHVTNRTSTGLLGPMFMNAINSVKSTTDAALLLSQARIPSARFEIPSSLKFQTGGLVPGANKTTQEARGGRDVKLLQNVNLIDPSVFDSFLATQEGIDRIINIISNNPEAVRESIALPTD